MSSIVRVVSGFQTGSDTGGILAAHALEIPTGGWVPADYRTEDGFAKEFMLSMGAKACDMLGYEHRTNLNVYDSDGTVLFGLHSSAGSVQTIRAIERYKKPNVRFHIANGELEMREAKKYLREWIEREHIKVLNIAGNRESKNRGICQCVCDFLIEALDY